MGKHRCGSLTNAGGVAYGHRVAGGHASFSFLIDMSLIHSFTVADYLPWATMQSLVRKLFRDGDYRMSLLIAAGSYMGLRISDLRNLTWAQLLDEPTFTINEQKTGKRRNIKVNASLQQHAQDCYDALKVSDKAANAFISQKGTIYSVQQINRLFKMIKEQYNLKIDHFSTHSLRKTFGRRVVEQAGDQSEMALIKLSELFNHSSTMITRRYLGLRQQELAELYDNLDL